MAAENLNGSKSDTPTPAMLQNKPSPIAIGSVISPFGIGRNFFIL